ncbi:MAG TPA: Gfo/Idh/MocA family oxidoreductase [Bryobacteraceae bacterium]|nr:Gfo/Idh/MocA family oxidoreductase [Bryobacteraceae bacterium]
MSSASRREFVQRAAAAAAPAVRPSWGQQSPNNRINLAVIGFRGRGRDHYRNFARIRGVRVAYLCDIDERLFPAAVAEIEKIGGYRPQTFFDIRKLLETKDLDAVSVATPDHWHALATIWACQAGKDVYVEKPVCHNLREGRKMVEAARKYGRMVQAGLNRRSELRNLAGVRFVQGAAFGPAYRARAVVYRGRLSVGTVQESSIPNGVHWDLFLGPAPYRPFTLNRFHYGWHYFWDTSTTEVGNNGVHALDLVRWAMDKHAHPVKVQCYGGLFADHSDQETPNMQVASFEYADGTIFEADVTTLPSPSFGGVQMGEFFYTPQGYITSAQNWTTVVGDFVAGTTPDPPSGISLRASNLSFPKISYKPGPPIPDAAGQEVSHFQNFIDCVRSRKREDLHCEILEGHMSTALCHLANIAFRTGRKLTFDPATETFPGDAEANQYLTRKYRAPYVVPDQV